MFTKNLAASLGVSHAEAAAMVSEAAAMIAARLSVPEEK